MRWGAGEGVCATVSAQYVPGPSPDFHAAEASVSGGPQAAHRHPGPYACKKIESTQTNRHGDIKKILFLSSGVGLSVFRRCVM